MAWRFKASKYKNAAPIVPKPEMCIRDICVGSYQTYGNNICASAAMMAFNWEHVGSSLAVLPLDDCGRKSKTMPLLHAHSDTITGMEFSPFHDGLLVTGSQDCLVKLWHIPANGLLEPLTNPECTLSQRQRRVEAVGFHPIADGLLHVASATVLSLWDLITQQESFSNNDHSDVIQSVSWKRDGKLIATSCKDKFVRIVDPRASSSLVSTATSHQSIKDSRIVWLGEQDRILTTGFDSARLRQVIIRDVRKFDTPEKTLELDCSTGILMPLYDPDTCMIFFAGKGDTTIGYMEVSEREPYLIEGIRHSGEQTKGACLVPKRALRVMEGEVNRVLQLTSNMVIPIMYQVPRKTYRDYHADLYPDTPGFITRLNSTMWIKGIDCSLEKMSLNPAKRGQENTEKVHRGNFSEYIKQVETMVDPTPKPTQKLVTSPPTALIKPQPKYVPPVEQNDMKGSENSSKIEFINVRDLVKDMEKPKKEENFHKLNENRERNANNEKTKSNFKDEIIDNEETNDCNDLPESDQGNLVIENNNTSESDYIDSIKKTNGYTVNEEKNNDLASINGNGVPSVPPKPMPRSSISEAGSGEEAYCNVNIVDGVPRPVARPRTTAQSGINSYKPRLGPKPFSSSQGSQEFSFDKVFCVPAAPITQSVNAQDNSISLQCNNNETSPVTELISPVKNNDDSIDVVNNVLQTNFNEKNSPISDTDKEVGFQNGKTDSSLEEEFNSSDINKPKTASTAERRKMFEVKSNSKEGADVCANDDAFDDGVGKFERGNNQRSSIAERRRLYEGRSVSVQETISTALLTSNVNTPEANQASPVLRRRDSLKSRKSPEPDDKMNMANNAFTKRTSTVFGRVSKFRHLKGTPGHKSTHIENIRNVSRQISGECDGFHANPYRVAVPLEGGGGRVAVLELKSPGRLPDGVTPALLHPNALCDWQWDPFNDARLIVACDDGIIREWIIPEEGLSKPVNSPARILAAHSDKIYLLRFHPRATDVLATASHDLTVKIWDLTSMNNENCKEKILLTGHKDQIFALAWSPCGAYLATASKDSLIRVYKPRTSVTPIKTGKGPVGSRGARVVWTLEGSHIVATGFDKVSERQIMIFNANDLSCLNTVGLDVSPAILIPFYDEDSSTLFLTGRGDSTIYCFEITNEPPYICALSHHRCASLHQGLSFLSKNQCAVDKVEFAKALRLTNTTIEPLSFTVPRIKSELFQDDLFPPTVINWEPTTTSNEWFKGIDRSPKIISLKPPGMDTLSASGNNSTPTTTNVSKVTSGLSAVQSYDKMGWNSDVIKAKQDEIQQSLTSKMEINLSLEQENMEGVDECEWDQ